MAEWAARKTRADRRSCLFRKTTNFCQVSTDCFHRKSFHVNGKNECFLKQEVPTHDLGILHDVAQHKKHNWHGNYKWKAVLFLSGCSCVNGTVFCRVFFFFRSSCMVRKYDSLLHGGTALIVAFASITKIVCLTEFIR